MKRLLFILITFLILFIGCSDTPPTEPSITIVEQTEKLLIGCWKQHNSPDLAVLRFENYGYGTITLTTGIGATSYTLYWKVTSNSVDDVFVHIDVQRETDVEFYTYKISKLTYVFLEWKIDDVIETYYKINK